MNEPFSVALRGATLLAAFRRQVDDRMREEGAHAAVGHTVRIRGDEAELVRFLQRQPRDFGAHRFVRGEFRSLVTRDLRRSFEFLRDEESFGRVFEFAARDFFAGFGQVDFSAEHSAGLGRARKGLGDRVRNRERFEEVDVRDPPFEAPVGDEDRPGRLVDRDVRRFEQFSDGEGLRQRAGLVELLDARRPGGAESVDMVFGVEREADVRAFVEERAGILRFRRDGTGARRRVEVGRVFLDRPFGERARRRSGTCSTRCRPSRSAAGRALRVGVDRAEEGPFLLVVARPGQDPELVEVGVFLAVHRRGR